MTHPAARRLVDQGLVTSIYRAVEPAYPAEGCGFVFEEPEGRWVVVPTDNRAELLHQRDPVRYPRGGADWFEPDMKPWLRAVRAGCTPRVIFHSHPEVGAYFSDGDHMSAVYEDDDGVVRERNPGVLHVVVSVRNGRADGAKLFQFTATTERFEAVAVFHEDGTLDAAV